MKILKKAIIAPLTVLGLLAITSCGSSDNPSTTTTNTTTGGSNTGLQPVVGTTKYASPTGKSTATGTSTDPLDISTAFLGLTAGDTLILKEGTYSLDQRILIPATQSGQANSYITVKNEDNKQVVVDFSNQVINSTSRGIQINANYWYIYGIDVMGAGDNGMYIAGSYNIIENCSFHENQDTGLQLGRADSTQSNVKDWPHNNLIKNCTSYNNYDYASYGENADGFAAKLTVGEGNIFDGCIAYRNADDGWDLYAKSDSGNVGTTIIKNCVSFENGWLLEPTAAPDDSDLNEYGLTTITTTAKMLAKTTNKAYTTRDGDGIGFKLGGSSMEGNVIVENCLAFNNRLHGFSDNSNPGILSLRNCTAYNNSVVPNGETGAITVTMTDANTSANFDTARTEKSYNNYYGLLSLYTADTNVINYVSMNGDDFRGSAGYSIFCLGKNKYTAFNKYMDASSYEATKQGTAYNDMSTDIFESVTFGYTVNGNRELHKALRNSDGSVNMGTMMNVTDSTMLTYCEGSQIGAKLNNTSWEAYDHYELTDFRDTTLTENQIALQEAADALTIMCNPSAVYQNVNLLTIVNGLNVTWSSSNELVVEIGTTEYNSISLVKYVEGIINRDRTEDKTVTLTATITSNEETITKDFKLVIKKDIPVIGSIVGFESRYILTQFQEYTIPSVKVLNGSYYSEKALIEGTDYTVSVNVLYAQSTEDFDNNNYYEISQVYTSLPGVYKVIYTINSLIDDEILQTSFYAYVVSEDAPIDLATSETGAPLYEVNVSRDGVTVSAELTNILGTMYVYATSNEVTSSAEVIEKGKAYDITDQTISSVYEMPNNKAYNVYIVISNKTGSSISKVYSKSVSVQEVVSLDDFHSVATSSADSTTIYLLMNNLDYTGYNWTTSTQSFGGLFNGNGYTISNLTINGLEKKDAAIFYKLSNGTIMNVNFENITINGASGVATVAGIVGQMSGGYLHHIGLKNVAVSAHTGASALVGQVSGGVNYITQISLVNDTTSTIKVTNKYAGGIVGNVQKDTTENLVELYVSNCYVKGIIGDGKDAGGYIGGIIGRAKNDYNVCVLQIEKCYFEGQVRTGKNYAGGIFAGSDNGAGRIFIIRCVSNCTIYFAGTVLDGLSDTTMAAKNCSPVYGRYTAGGGSVTALVNYGSFADAAIITDSESFAEVVGTRAFWYASVSYDLDNIWEFDETTSTISLRTPSPTE